MSLRVATYLPFTITCYLNGHHFVSERLRGAGVALSRRVGELSLLALAAAAAAALFRADDLLAFARLHTLATATALAIAAASAGLLATAALIADD